jgi:hypothetical protein
MFPRYSHSSRINSIPTNIENLCQLSACQSRSAISRISLSYNSYLQRIKFVCSYCFSLSLCSISFSVFCVSFLISPVEIIKRVIKTTSDSMTRKHPFWTRRDKSQKDKIRDLDLFRFPINIKTNHSIFMRFIPCKSWPQWMWNVGRFVYASSNTVRKDISFFIGKISSEVRDWFHRFTIIEMRPSFSAYSNAFIGLTRNPDAY